MTRRPAAGAGEAHVRAPARGGLRLAGRQLIGARLAWLLLAALGLVLAILAVPIEWGQFQTVCAAGALCPEPHLTPGRLHDLHALGLPDAAFGIYLIAVESLWAATYVSVGAIIIWRRSDELMAVLGAFFLLTFGLADSFLGAGGAPSQGLPLIVELIEFLGFASLFLFLYLFPQGRFMPRWTGWLALIAIAWQVPHTFFRTSPVSTDTWPPPIQLLLLLATLGGVIAIQVYRYRRVSDAVERQQTKWVVLGLVVTALGFLGVSTLITFQGPSPDRLAPFLLEATGFYLVLLPLPLSIGVSILRHRLWGVDLIVNRALVYGALTAVVIAVFVLIVGGLGQVFQARGNIGLSLVATAIVAVLFQPLRERLQRGVNRLIYGQRDEPYAVLSRLARQLEGTLAPDAVLSTIVQTVADTLKLSFAAIAHRQDGEYVVVAATGDEPPDPLRLPLMYQGDTVGQLVLAPRLGESGFSAADRRLLEDLARQAGVAAYAVSITAEVQLARERLVTAREEERRRLRRDLHDGLGPALASVTLMADAAGNLLARDPAAATKLLNELKEEAKAATAEIRRVVYQLRPPALDELGLIPALREQAEQYRQGGLQVSIRAPGSMPPLPAAVEVAAYRIVQESVTNVLRHAKAKTCTVWLEVDDEVRLEIADDGRGMNGARPGVGLTSMRERAEELGGTCVIEAGSAGGTVVRARLPMGRG